MAVPDDASKKSLLWSAKANELGHGYLGARGRRWSIAFIYISAVLGYVAGFSGLADLISKSWVGIIALAAGVSTTVLILLLTTLRPDAHLQAEGKYQTIYLGVVWCDMNTSEGLERFKYMWHAFGEVVSEVNAGKYALTPGQRRKYKALAKEELGNAVAENARDEAVFWKG